MIVAVDIRPQKITVGFSHLGEHIEDELQFSPPKTQRNLAKLIAEHIKKTAGHHIEAVGISAPSQLNLKQGKIVDIEGLNYKNLKLTKPLSQLLDCKVVLGHNATVAASAEIKLQKNTHKLVYFDLSYNLEGGVAIAGLPLLHTYSNLALQIVNYEHQNRQTYRDLVAGLFLQGHIDSQDLLKLNLNTHSWKLLASHLATGVYNTICILQPECVVIGGELAPYYKKFIGPLKTQLARWQAPPAKIVLAHYGNSGLVGAAQLAANTIS